MTFLGALQGLKMGWEQKWVTGLGSVQMQMSGHTQYFQSKGGWSRKNVEPLATRV